MKITWCSDIHLNFLKKGKRVSFYKELKESEGDIILISGDIAESTDVASLIEEMTLFVEKEVYFVLGNHDFYTSSIKDVKESVRHLNYLSDTPGLQLDKDTILIGVDGWGDCRNGNYKSSPYVMNDWIYIEDLKRPYIKGTLVETLRELADKDAEDLKKKVLNALDNKHIIITTHVPPTKESSLFKGKQSEDGLPYYSSKALEDAILPIAKSNPKVKFTWLSGHTHCRAKHKPCNNMTIRVAESEYYNPKIERIIE